MKLANKTGKLFAVLMVSSCCALGFVAQNMPADKMTASPAPAKNASSEKVQAAAGKRDPFSPLVSEKKDTASTERLPPGKAGLVVAAVRVDGVVRSQEGMIGVVSNSEDRVYFIREGDRLYDGDVEKIGLDGITFRENSKDAFGKPIQRMVTKRIYVSAGEQQ